MASVRAASPTLDGGYRQYMGGYGRPKPKAKPPSLAQLDERNSKLREENAALRRKVTSFDEEDRQSKVGIAQLSGELGSLTLQAERLERLTDDADRDFAASQENLVIEIATLREERDAWLRRMKGFQSAAAETEKELEELDELATDGVQKRRQLQSECLSLQQECEDARVELQETRNLLGQSGSTVERMVRQKLDLEWELQEQVTKQKVLHTVLEQAGYKLADEADEQYRQRESLVAASRQEVDKIRGQAESFRVSAVADHREVELVNYERARLEREAAASVKELQRLERLRQSFEEDTLQEHHQTGVNSEVLQTARRQRESLSHQLGSLEDQSRDNVAMVAEMHGERTKLLLGKAQRQAAKVLAADAPDLDFSDFPTMAAGGAVRNVNAASPLGADLAAAGSLLRVGAAGSPPLAVNYS